MAIDIKQLYRRFRQWQREPFDYALKSEQQHQCANCHRDYTGNYCPYCSQKAGLGKVTWASVVKGVSIVYGMDSRSLLYSLLQLFLRPGYLISDYINGERQVSFPPVKMLLLVAIIYELVIHWAGVREVPLDPGGDLLYTRQFAIWFNNNPGWGQMIKCLFLIPPTWLFFRHSPRNTRHTLPAGFYIQVFMTTLILMIMSATDKFLGDGFYLIILFYYVVAYHQLFGYGWWGSFWRTLLAGMEGFALMLLLSFAVEAFFGNLDIYSPAVDIVLLAVMFIVNAALVAAVYYISRHASRRAQKRSNQSQDDPQEDDPQDAPQEDEPAV